VAAAPARARFAKRLGLGAALTAAFGLWLGAGAGGEDAVRWVDDLATVAAAAAATVLCALAARRHRGRVALSWLLFAVACAAWTLGEGIWALYDLVLLGEVPVPSWADAAYLAALPPAAAALLVHPALRGRALGRTRTAVDGLVVAASIFVLGWGLVLEPLRRSTDVTSLGGLVTLAYPLSDVVILFLAVLVIRGTTDRSRFDVWCLLGGILAIAFSDAVYTYLTSVNTYATGNGIDAGWFGGYLAIAVGASCSGEDRIPERRGEARSLTTAAVVAPFVPLLAALGFTAAKVQLGGRLDGVTLAGAFALVGLVLVRQALLAIDLLVPDGDGETSVADRIVEAVGRPARTAR